MDDEDVFVSEEEAVVLVVIFGVPEDVEGRAEILIQTLGKEITSLTFIIRNTIQV
jgi:hypothetical protein